jgi:hypothetical protein
MGIGVDWDVYGMAGGRGGTELRTQLRFKIWGKAHAPCCVYSLLNLRGSHPSHERLREPTATLVCMERNQAVCSTILVLERDEMKHFVGGKERSQTLMRSFFEPSQSRVYEREFDGIAHRTSRILCIT